MKKRKNLKLEDYKWDAEWCMGCRGCTWVDHIYATGIQFPNKCPSLYREKFDAYSPFGKNKISLKILDGGLDFTPRLLDILYKCNMCGACDVGCKRNLDFDPGMVFETFRIRAVDAKAGPLPAHKAVNDNIKKKNNRYGEPQNKRKAWLPKSAKLSKKPEMLYYVGCNTSYKNKEIAKATVGILDKAKVKYNLFPQEVCCGKPMYEVGCVDDALKQAKKNIAALKKSGADTIITSCAECFKTWKVDYPKMLDKRTDQMGYKVLHITQLAVEKIKDGTLKPKHKVPMRVTYHDPCNLNRRSEDWIPWHGTRGKYGCTEPIKEYRRGIGGVTNEPRMLLGLPSGMPGMPPDIPGIPGIEAKEMHRMDANSMCCGAGGGVADAFPEFTRDTANHRMDEADDIGIETIVSACPYCKDTFNKTAKEGGRPVKAVDITQILYKSLTGKGGSL